jgi:hypothetical protein
MVVSFIIFLSLLLIDGQGGAAVNKAMTVRLIRVDLQQRQ